MLPAHDKISPLSPSFQHNSSLAISPRFNWRQLETAVSGSTEEHLLTQLSQLQQAVSSGCLSSIRQISQGGLDLGLPLRGQTALYLAVTLHRSDVTREILREMMKQKNIKRNINMFSVDNASRRETALICAARTGQVDSVRHLINYGADLELRDGEVSGGLVFLASLVTSNQGHTALWCAVREQREEMVVYLVGRGAKVFYNNNDPSCPLQLACKTPLLKERGQKIACHLVIHGANLEYQDIALRNTLFWVVYNNNRDLAYFIIQCGARVRPWSWVEPSHLPEPLRQDKLLLNMIVSAWSQPQKLGLICIRSVRKTLSERQGGRSILSAIDRLPCDQDLRRMVRFECASSKREQVIRKLHRWGEDYSNPPTVLNIQDYTNPNAVFPRLQETTEV